MIVERGPKPEDHETRGGRFRFGVSTEANERHPERNEDSHFADPERGAFGVFDGMSNPEETGQVASRIADERVRTVLSGIPEDASPSAVSETMERALTEADREIAEYARLHPEYEGMGSTASVIKFIESEGRRFAVIGHVGDSRIYRFRDGRALFLTLDDTLPLSFFESEEDRQRRQELFSAATTPADLPSYRDLEDFMKQNVLTSALGVGSSPKVSAVEVHPDDRFVITSDGVHDNLTSQEITAILQQHIDPDRATVALVQAARARSRDKNHLRAKPDDMTAIIVEKRGPLPSLLTMKGHISAAAS